MLGVWLLHAVRLALSSYGNNYLAGADALCRLFRNITEIEKLSELGVLFLLFEMGLELSLDRLKVRW